MSRKNNPACIVFVSNCAGDETVNAPVITVKSRTMILNMVKLCRKDVRMTNIYNATAKDVTHVHKIHPKPRSQAVNKRDKTND